MSKPLELLRTVNNLAKVHYSNEHSRHVDFLSACHNALAAYFKEYFKGEENDSFIFSALSFSNNDTLHHIDENVDDNNDRSYIFNEESVCNWEGLKMALKNYKSQVLKGEMISITKILLGKNSSPSHKDLFFVTEEYSSDVSDSSIIFQYHLEQFIYSEEEYCRTNRIKLDSFYSVYGGNEPTNVYDRYVWNHHKLAEEYKNHNPGKAFLLHYIKPSIAELDYGLLLSLATNRQLTADELAFVNLILYRVVSQKVKENIKEERITDLIQTTYSLGHNLKNRLLESDALMNSLIDDIENSSLQETEKHDIKRYATNISSKVKSLSNTGKILDLIGRFMTERKWQDKWLSNSNYSFNEKISNGEFTRVSISGKYAKIKVENFPTTLKLKGWLGNDGKYRPADFVYEELFFELLVNTLTYGKAYVEGDKKYVDVSISSEGNKIIIVNTPAKRIDENDKFEDVKNVSIKPTVIGHGGLLYMYKFLTQTNIGDIDIFLDTTNNQFKIILELKGICHDE